MKKYSLIIGLIVFPILVLFACREKEKIDQGRVIAYDKTKGTLTLIRDKNNDSLFPDYSQLPPITYNLPEDFLIDYRKPKEFPIIDRERKMITVYSRRQRILTTFTLPDKYFDLPEYTWNAGDEVRIYFKERKALRLINTTKLGFVKD